jgi:hypothetical protein
MVRLPEPCNRDSSFFIDQLVAEDASDACNILGIVSGRI